MSIYVLSVICDVTVLFLCSILISLLLLVVILVFVHKSSRGLAVIHSAKSNVVLGSRATTGHW